MNEGQDKEFILRCCCADFSLSLPSRNGSPFVEHLEEYHTSLVLANCADSIDRVVDQAPKRGTNHWTTQQMHCGRRHSG